VKNTLVLISNRREPARRQDRAARRRAAVEHGGSVGTPDWLAPGIACDLPFDGRLRAVACRHRCGRRADRQPAQALLVADMESTMIENEMLDELADFLGLRDEDRGHHRAAP
jgi:phosphoserine phosphatase